MSLWTIGEESGRLGAEPLGGAEPSRAGAVGRPSAPGHAGGGEGGAEAGGGAALPCPALLCRALPCPACCRRGARSAAPGDGAPPPPGAGGGG